VFVVDIYGFVTKYPDIAANAVATVDKIVINDGTEIAVDNSKILYGDLEGKGNFRIEIYNEYGAGTKADPPIDKSLIVDATSIEVTFTLAAKN